MSQRLVIDKESSKYKDARRKCLKSIFLPSNTRRSITFFEEILDNFVDEILTVQHAAEENPWRSFG